MTDKASLPVCSDTFARIAKRPARYTHYACDVGMLFDLKAKIWVFTGLPVCWIFVSCKFSL